ncbi:retinol dehydrogenase 11 isoform X3 [Takifugu rubripes]|uniref:retinol dehydrogenase 11 isoform X3 n=1 Tax=Takifugu rubripes TaxID=31033 RepID=UPI00114592EF|nr:retinol dehydrogenase 11-like isoform X3 [Takifugu rubripes]
MLSHLTSIRSLFFKNWSSDVRLDGKTAIVTGGNAGIGKETVKDLASRGARVILACRDMAKGEQAARDIMREVRGAKVVARLLDLADTKSICQFAENIYNSHFFLTYLLLDLLKHSAPSRVINLSSTAHNIGKIQFDDLNGENNYHPIKAYAQSKLANVLFTRELAKRTEALGVSTYSVDPGMVDTGITRHLMRPLVSFVKTFGFLIRTPAEGAYTTIYCIVTPEDQMHNGGYYSNCAAAQSSIAGQDDGTALKLWAASCHMLGTRWR